VRAVVQKESWRKTPTLLDEDGDIRGWMDRHLDYTSPRRRWQTQGAALKLWFYLGRQWIVARTQLAAHNGGYHFEDIHRESSAAFPQPVTNMIAPAVDNEVSRLARKEYVPDTSAGKNKPEYIAAAKLAKEILVYEMGKEIWDDKREHLCFNLCIDAVSICRTSWDENDIEQTLVAAPEAVHCPMCKKFFASPKIPRDFLETGIPSDNGLAQMKYRETMRPVELTGEMSQGQADALSQVEMAHCPYCDNMSLLKPFEMSPEEAVSGDQFGRPMGLMVPRGEGAIEVISLHEYYPENGGIGVEPYDQRIQSQVKVRPLEWIALRYPELRDTLDPEDPAQLLRYNPLYADRIFQGGGGGYGLGSGAEAYYNHARVFETIIPPQPMEGLDKGAHFVKVGDKVVKRELCVEVEGERGFRLVPRVKYHFGRFKRMPGNFWGRSFVDDMIPLQRRLNELDAQVIDLRERGIPTVWLPEGAEVYTSDDQTGSLRMVNYDGVQPTWSPRDAVMNGIPLTGSVYSEERASILRDMQALGAPQDIEMGQSTGSVKTTSGLMLLSEEASRKRAPRERSMLALYKSVFEHFLQMTWAFRKEDASYEVQGEGKVYEQESYKGTDLLGDIRVEMAARVGYDQTLYNKEATAEALTLGLYKLTDPAAVDKCLDLMKLPKDVNENQTLQIERAEQAWSKFMKEREVPNVDPTLYDALTWYAVLGKRWHTDDAYLLQRRCGWNKMLPALVTWEEKLQETLAQEAISKPIYGKLPPDQWQQAFQQGSQLVAQAMQTYEQAMASFQQASALVPPGGMAPQPPAAPAMTQFPQPPPQGFLPDALEQKVYTIFRRMVPDFDQALVAANRALELSEIVKPSEQAMQAMELDAVLKMRAVIEALRLMATGQIATAGAAPPVPGGQMGQPGAPPQPTPGAQTSAPPAA
jgi:hypothetical protein